MGLAIKNRKTFQIGLSLVLAFICSFVAGTNLEAQDATKSSDSASVSKEKTDDAKVDAETLALHNKLSKYLTGTKWTGQFTMDGQGDAKTDYYEILTAEKNEVGDYWNLVARIKYGNKDQTIPLPPIEIKFAGKTPVITVDKVRFPGFGTFDARVLIRNGKYAGTWAHSGGAGGHMFGVIERMDADEVKASTEKVKQAEGTKKPDVEKAKGK